MILQGLLICENARNGTLQNTSTKDEKKIFDRKAPSSAKRYIVFAQKFRTYPSVVWGYALQKFGFVTPEAWIFEQFPTHLSVVHSLAAGHYTSQVSLITCSVVPILKFDLNFPLTDVT